MKNIDLYIVEKLVIDKDVQVNTGRSVWDSYVGDKLLNVVYKKSNFNSSITFNCRLIYCSEARKSSERIDFTLVKHTDEHPYTYKPVFLNSNDQCEYKSSGKMYNTIHIVLNIHDGLIFLKNILNAKSYKDELMKICDKKDRISDKVSYSTQAEYVSIEEEINKLIKDLEKD